MERKYFIAINFDLDTHKLKALHPGNSYQNAYDDLRRFLKWRGYSHRQGSGYISDEKQSAADIYNLMDELSTAYLWICECDNRIDVTNVGRQHDLTDLLKPIDIASEESMGLKMY